MVDATRLRALLDRTGDELTHLDRLAGLEPDHLLANGDRVAAVKYRFIVAIEAAIDACRHIVASEGLRAPTDFADAFAAVCGGRLSPGRSGACTARHGALPQPTRAWICPRR